MMFWWLLSAAVGAVIAVFGAIAICIGAMVSAVDESGQDRSIAYSYYSHGWLILIGSGLGLCYSLYRFVLSFI